MKRGSAISVRQKAAMMLTLEQKRSLGIRMGLVEEELKRIRHLLLQGEDQGLFSRTRDDLSEEEKRLVGEKLGKLNESLASLKGLFDLSHSQKEFTLRGMIKALSLYLIVQLEGSMSSKLRGYGEVDARLGDSLDPKLKEMISLLEEMERAV